jgi:hypothetical protein
MFVTSGCATDHTRSSARGTVSGFQQAVTAQDGLWKALLLRFLR